MLEIDTLMFLALVAIGAAMQTITGFAMGLIVMAGVTIFGIADIAFSAAVVSFISLLNAVIALRSGYRHINWRFVLWISAGLLPSIVIGLLLLNFMSEFYYETLQMLLGVVVIFAGCVLMVSPNPYKNQSSSAGFAFFGAAGGLLAGMYSAGGAPLAYFLYRQPVSINTVRFSLLMVFAMTTSFRAMIVAATGQLTDKIIEMSLLSIPVVIVVTILFSKLTSFIPDRVVRRLVFVVLVAAGAFLVLKSTLGYFQS